jgi:23S rRNA pseudouridine2605 synthase
MRIRLNKYLALCGLGSRRSVESLVLSGQIKINNRRVETLSVYVETENDTVYHRNRKLKPVENYQYLILNKPKGYITTRDDELNRPKVIDLIPERYRNAGLFPVGRLDKDTEGILVFTNDGDLAQKLSRPRYKVEKEYIVQLDKPLERKDKEKIEKGVFIHQLKVKTGSVRLDAVDDSWQRIRFIMSEGKKRQIRYTFGNMGYRVNKLKRTGYGPLTLSGIKTGDYRALKEKEIKLLKKTVSGEKDG